MQLGNASPTFHTFYLSGVATLEKYSLHLIFMRNAITNFTLILIISWKNAPTLYSVLVGNTYVLCDHEAINDISPYSTANWARVG